jgi:hypothetical protein
MVTPAVGKLYQETIGDDVIVDTSASKSELYIVVASSTKIKQVITPEH